MNPKRTWLLLALAAGVFVFIWLYERPAAERGATSSVRRPWTAFNAGLATSVEVLLRTNQVVRVERTNENWLLRRPIEAPAFSLRIDGLLKVFSQLNERSHISGQEAQPLSAFGLDPPQATVVVQQERNHWELRIGRKTPAGNQVYVQLVGADGVFFTDAAFLDRLPRSVEDWRDPTFLPLKGLNFDRLRVETRKGATTSEFEVQLDAARQRWMIKQPMETRADNLRLDELIRELRAWAVRRFWAVGAKPDWEACGLQPPEVIVSFGRGTNDLLVAQFGKSPTNDANLVYARCLPQSDPVLVDKPLLDKLRAPFAEYRDPQLVGLTLASANLVEVRAAESFALQRQTNGDWWLTQPERVRADPELVQDFFRHVANLKVLDYVLDNVTDAADYARYGLTKPSRQYVFRESLTNAMTGLTNRLVAELDFGTNLADKVYARVQGENSVYAASLEASLPLPVHWLQLRDRQIWQFSTNDVKGVTITIKQRTWRLLRTTAGQWSEPPATNYLDLPLPNLLEETLYRLGQLKAVAWTARGEEQLAHYQFPSEDHHLAIELSVGGNPQTLSLDFGPQTPTGNVYAATVLPDGQRVIFEFPVRTYELYFDSWRLLPPPAK